MHRTGGTARWPPVVMHKSMLPTRLEARLLLTPLPLRTTKKEEYPALTGGMAAVSLAPRWAAGTWGPSSPFKA
eukprot:8042856-Pyramimonas_sp.AAC.1